MVSFVTQSQLGEVVVGSQSQLTRSLVVFSHTGGNIALWRIQQCIRGIIVPSEDVK